ncbi:FAD-dependent monooxygenase [Bradyrhizobium yuanmingense]|uniref:FAD-dependent monooxygenase n=1 Tax=Bradyrhizobium yuanmingense TaxID=108015 RepID=UPI0004B3145E|nr:FAD-dependent monooxygenase [Bradyrhizobium yuanmingense]
MTLNPIVIIGAGIGGLAAALGLQRRGFKVRVFERAVEIREIGAGLIVTANARRALKDLGLDDGLAALSSRVPVLHGCDYRTGEITRGVRNEDIEKRYGFSTLQVHRADLHGLLMAAVDRNDPAALHAGHEFASLDQTERGVNVKFVNGASIAGDALIGADGNASAVRSFVFGGEAAAFNGQVAFRALIPKERVPKAVAELQFAMHTAPRRYLLHYPLRHGEIMNLIGCGQSKAWEAEGWSIPATNDEFEQEYSDFWPELLDLIRAIPPGGLFKWGLRDREPLQRWVKGRVAMLGDAAHPMTPFLGQGACMAIEDGMLLARAFGAARDVPAALARYEAARKTRGNNVQLWSREEGLALQDPARPRKGAIELGLLDYDPVLVAV